MAVTGVSICNEALLLIGADDINSFDDNTNEARLCKSVYQTTKETLYQYHPWRFSLMQKDLGGALNQDPLFKWRYKFQLPVDMLRIVALENDENYEIYETTLYTDVNPCRLIYQRDVGEGKMPAYFKRCLVFHLARLFGMSLQEDAAKMQVFDQAADKETARARSIDTQQQPNIGIPDRNFTLVNIRG